MDDVKDMPHRAAAPTALLQEALEGLAPIAEEQAEWSEAVRPRIWCYLTDRPVPIELVGSVRAIVFHDDEVVTVTNVKEEYFLPGVRREPDEEIDQTIRRELLEETGWHVGPLRQIAVMHLYFDNDPPPGHRPPHPDVLWPVFVTEAQTWDATARIDDGYDLTTQLRSIDEVEKWPLRSLDRHLLEAAKRARHG